MIIIIIHLLGQGERRAKPSGGIPRPARWRRSWEGLVGGRDGVNYVGAVRGPPPFAVEHYSRSIEGIHVRRT